MDNPVRALAGVTVLDFSTLLPGPYASLVLADAGASVLKVERPEGDGLRHHDRALFPMLNAGKASVVADLTRDEDRDRVRALAARADVVIEGFRPGVMDRLGLGYAGIRAGNPEVVYCSVTGYGQSGPRARTAGHDLNYVATTGLLDVVHADGLPVMPAALVADIAGGAYPAVIAILLALARRSAGGGGAHLDVAMTDNVFPMQYWALPGAVQGESPTPSAAPLTGGSPRYRIYRTADGRAVAATPLEPRFWDRFCAAVDLPPRFRGDQADPAATAAAIAERIAAKDAAHWSEVFAEADCCATVVAAAAEAAADPALRERGVLERRVVDGDGTERTAMPLPVPGALRGPDRRTSPALGRLDLNGLSWEDVRPEAT
ncbi:CaiB/BaiF CoA transferase family protein [Pseudonocardia sp. EC080625-04]|uniref:CaiB/BaiF CoA transferase family protein n=1 Tax=Pseudonocardia sp. EC080625-04 TaxID=1096868 RepID=UPI0019310581|nr:CoA transferase [Pseudonocardia sp. EC080625-04]